MAADSPDDPRAELAIIAQQARAWLQWTADCGAEEVSTAELPSAELLAALPLDEVAALRPTPSARPPRGEGRAGPSQGERPSAQRRQPAPQRRAPQPLPSARPEAPSAAPRGGLPEAERRRRLQALADEVRECRKCRLCETRTQTVFARGDPMAQLVFVGEGPGEEEDRQGVPFVGKAGQLLDKMITAMGFSPDEVYICNVIRCRPPNNRRPEPDEITACYPYVRQQLELIAPQVIVTLGATASAGLLDTRMGITRLRGNFKLYRGRIPVMPTYHPAYLLRSPEKKREVWSDLKQVMRRFGKQPPPRKGTQRRG